MLSRRSLLYARGPPHVPSVHTASSTPSGVHLTGRADGPQLGEPDQLAHQVPARPRLGFAGSVRTLASVRRSPAVARTLASLRLNGQCNISRRRAESDPARLLDGARTSMMARVASLSDMKGGEPAMLKLRRSHRKLRPNFADASPLRRVAADYHPCSTSSRSWRAPAYLIESLASRACVATTGALL